MEYRYAYFTTGIEIRGVDLFTGQVLERIDYTLDISGNITQAVVNGVTFKYTWLQGNIVRATENFNNGTSTYAYDKKINPFYQLALINRKSLEYVT
jgi:hypothetical protein